MINSIYNGLFYITYTLRWNYFSSFSGLYYSPRVFDAIAKPLHFSRSCTISFRFHIPMSLKSFSSTSIHLFRDRPRGRFAFIFQSSTDRTAASTSLSLIITQVTQTLYSLAFNETIHCRCFQFLLEYSRLNSLPHWPVLASRNGSHILLHISFSDVFSLLSVTLVLIHTSQPYMCECRLHIIQSYI